MIRRVGKTQKNLKGFCVLEVLRDVLISRIALQKLGSIPSAKQRTQRRGDTRRKAAKNPIISEAHPIEVGQCGQKLFSCSVFYYIFYYYFIFLVGDNNALPPTRRKA